MEMFLKLFLIILIRSTQAEPLLKTLYELEGGIQVTACSVSGARCEGVVLLADWVVVSDSCIHTENTKHIYVQKGAVNCTQDIKITAQNLKQIKSRLGTYLEMTTPAMVPTKDTSVRIVLARYSHPLAPNVDIALLRLNWPYADELHNGTLSCNALNILDVWMESILYPSTEKTLSDQTESKTQIQYSMYSTPIKMFFATVILPSASFILFFLFIVFYTGTTDETKKIPYKTLNNDKESSHV